MTGYKPHLYLLFAYLASYCLSANWRMDFKQEYSKDFPESQPNVIKLVKGKYMGFFANLTKLISDPYKNVQGKLLLDNQNVYKTVRASYSFDTKNSTTVYMEIGVSCTQPDEGPSTIQLTTEDKDIEISPFQISFSNGGPYELDFLQVNRNIPFGAYGIIYEVLTINNVDTFKITFEVQKTEPPTQAVIEEINVPRYNGNPLSQTVRTRYYFTSNTTEKAIFDVRLSSTCFKSIIPTITFKNEVDVIASPSTLLTTIIKTAKRGSIDIPGSIAVEMSIEQVPMVAYCAMVNAFYLPPLTKEDVIAQTKEETIDLRFSYSYFEKPGKQQFLFFGLAQFTSFSMNCVFESVHVNNPVQEQIIFGYTSDTQVQLALFPEPTRNFPVQCLTWKVKKSVPEAPDEFKKKAIPYCYEFFTNYTIARDKNGCMECMSFDVSNTYTALQDESLLNLCIKSDRACQSNYSGNITAKAEELKAKLATGALIAQELSLPASNYDVITIYHDNDNETPDKSKISIENFSIADKTASFTLSTTEKKKVHCDAVIGDMSTIGLFRYDYPKFFNIDNTTSTIESYDLKSLSWLGQPVNFILQCYNLPFLIFAIKRTEPFLIKQFKLSATDFNVTQPIEPVDCANYSNYYNIQCIEMDHSSYVHLDTKEPRDNYDKSIKEFLGKNNKDKLDHLISQANSINDGSYSLQGKLNLIILINYMLGLTNCREYLNYNNCRGYKQRTQTELVNFLKTLLGADIINNLSKGVSTEQFEKNIILSLESLFYMIDNADSFTASTTAELINVIRNVFSNLNGLFAKTEYQAIPRDIVRLISSLLSIFSDLVVFNDYEGNYKNNINKTTSFINSTDVTSYMRLMTDMLEVMAKVGIDNLDLEDHQYRIIKLLTNDTKRIGVELGNGFYIDYPNDHLVKKYKASSIGFTVFKKYYPLRSIKNQDGYHSTAVSIKVFAANNSEIMVKDLEKEHRFNMSILNFLEEQMFCYYYNDSVVNQFETKGIETIKSSTNPLNCYTDHLTDFIRLTIDPGNIPVPPKGFPWLYILIIVLGGILLLGGIVFLIYKCRRKKNVESSVKDINNEGLFLINSNE